MRSPSRWIVLGVVSSALLLIVVDMTVLYTALPRLTHDLHASASEKLWILNVYALVVAGLLPGMGALGDRYGARRLFTAGLVVFGCASLLAAFSPDPEWLISARVLLAVGAAMMMPATLAIIRHTFEDPDERALAIGIWAAVASGGAALGPVLGGLLLEYFWWGSVFLINLPIVIVAFVLAFLVIPRGRGNPGRPFDIIGSVQIMIGLVGVTYAVKEISKPEPSLQALLAAGVVGLVFVVLFVRRQMRAPVPMLDFALFRSRTFSMAVVGAMVASASLAGLEFAITQRFQLVQGLSPLEAGLTILPVPIASFFAGPLASLALRGRAGAHLLWAALALLGLGVLAYLLLADMGRVAEIGALLLIGAGLGAAMTAASATIMLGAPAESAGMAASVEEVSYELGNAMGIAILGSLMAATYTMAFQPPAGLATPEAAQGSIDGALIAAERLGGDGATLLVAAAEQAFNSSFLTVMLVCVGILMATALLAAMFRHKGGAPV
ncbi:MFS transporter [Xanthobacteraceae bacterium A53D]